MIHSASQRRTRGAISQDMLGCGPRWFVQSLGGVLDHDVRQSAVLHRKIWEIEIPVIERRVLFQHLFNKHTKNELERSTIFNGQINELSMAIFSIASC